MLKPSWLTRGLLVATLTTVIGVTIALASAAPAQAHDSKFCGHYTLQGERWRLEYVGYRRAWQDRHHHFNDHISGSYWVHQDEQFCGYYSSGGELAAARGADGATHVPPAAAVQVDVPVKHRGADVETRAYATEAFVNCLTTASEPKDWYMCVTAWRTKVTAEPLITGLGTYAPVTVVELQPLGLGLDQTYLGRRVPRPRTGLCVVSVLDRNGGRPSGADIRRPKIVEVATPQVAADLGHPCE